MEEDIVCSPDECPVPAIVYFFTYQEPVDMKILVDPKRDNNIVKYSHLAAFSEPSGSGNATPYGEKVLKTFQDGGIQITEKPTSPAIQTPPIHAEAVVAMRAGLLIFFTNSAFVMTMARSRNAADAVWLPAVQISYAALKGI
jgi:hypothetical protein